MAGLGASAWLVDEVPTGVSVSQPHPVHVVHPHRHRRLNAAQRYRPVEGDEALALLREHRPDLVPMDNTRDFVRKPFDPRPLSDKAQGALTRHRHTYEHAA